MSTPEEVLRLRTRMNDLLSMGVIEGDSTGTYQQTLLQVLKEAETRKLQCEQLAQSLEVQLHQARAQATAFGMMGNLIYAVVNGMANKEEQRIRETQEREAEAKAREVEALASQAEIQSTEDQTMGSEGNTPKKRSKKVASGADT